MIAFYYQIKIPIDENQTLYLLYNNKRFYHQLKFNNIIAYINSPASFPIYNCA